MATALNSLDDTFAGLRARLTGELLTPGDDGWDVARTPWTLNVHQLPDAVVLAETDQDVVDTVAFADRAGLRVAPQGTGHNAAPLGDLAGTILLRTTRMRRVRIDPVGMVARVEAGVLWQELVDAAAAFGLTGLVGSSPDVGVVGYTVGGGVSWFGRSHGLAANSVLAADVVTADGTLRRVDAENDADLFWAVRGGGGGFGIVTALELRLFPIAEVYAGALFWPVESGHEVWHVWRQWVAGLPEHVTSWARFMTFPPLPEVPEPLRSRSFMIVEAMSSGDPTEAAAMLTPLRVLSPVMDTFATIPTTALTRVHMDPEGPSPAVGDGLLLDEFPAEAVDALVAVGGAGSGSPLVSLEVRHLGGALARVPDGAGALGRMSARFGVFAVGIPREPQVEWEIRERVQAVREALRPWAAAVSYLNLTERKADAALFFPPADLARLREVKRCYDPDDMIRSNHPVG